MPPQKLPFFKCGKKLKEIVDRKVKMDIQRCFEILELDRGASPDEAKQTYKDIVNVWHPDRFSNNPRLKRKAEEKLKEVNVAYETVKSFLSRKQEAEPEQKPASQAKAEAEAEVRTKARAETEYHKAQAGPQARDKIEVAVEAGTRIVFKVCSCFYKTLRRIVVSQVFKAGPQDKVEPGRLNQREWQSRGDCRGKGRGRGRGMGKGRGVGKGGGGGVGGMGRGRG